MRGTAVRLTAPQVDWQEERCTLTLEGEPVLEYVLSWPQVRGGGLGGRWISRYYARLARAWRLRWQREALYNILPCCNIHLRHRPSRDTPGGKRPC